MKVIDKINAHIATGEKFFSFEFFPPRTEEGVEALWEKLDKMVTHQPLFCDITWGAGGSTADLTLDIATRMQNQVCVETMMHLTCTNMPQDKLRHALDRVKAEGLQNILALRGDPPKGQSSFTAVEGGFGCALDLVRYIRASYGDYFGIAVSGYPEMHPDVIDAGATEEAKAAAYAAELAYLKAKVDAGGELVVTQLFYDVDTYLKFAADCRAAGISALVLPGIMPIQTYAGFKRMTDFCKTHVPAAVAAALEPIKDDEEAVRAYGVQLGAQMVSALLAAGVPGVHMYSLNQDRTVLGILERVGAISTSRLPRAIPWRRPTTLVKERFKEGVRPMYWLQRPRAYLARTAHWPDYPHGRWGSRAAANAFARPAEGASALALYQPKRPTSEKGLAARRAALAAAPLGDIAAPFRRHFCGGGGVLPWAESEQPTPEAAAMSREVAALLDRGLLVVAAAGAVDGAPSGGDAWGAPGGRVYAKAVLEFFAPPEAAAALEEGLARAGGSVRYAAARSDGKVWGTLRGPTAVAWGVFPGAELLQPLVAERAAFGAWAEEAFALWTDDWAPLFAEDDAASRAALARVRDTYTLFSIVDEQYTGGDAGAALLEAVGIKA